MDCYRITQLRSPSVPSPSRGDGRSKSVDATEWDSVSSRPLSFLPSKWSSLKVLANYDKGYFRVFTIRWYSSTGIKNKDVFKVQTSILSNTHRGYPRRLSYEGLNVGDGVGRGQREMPFRDSVVSPSIRYRTTLSEIGILKLDLGSRCSGLW